MPKNYKDERKIGKPISHKDLNVFMETARTRGIQIGTPGNIFGGFEHYYGDTKVLFETIDKLDASIQYAREKGLYNGNVILKYDNVLGYRGDNSMVDIDAFAITRGHTITLNKFMFDDSTYLKREYKDAMKNGMFTQGTDYSNIVNHEFGHIIDKKNRRIRTNIIKILRKEAENAKMNLKEYIINKISVYASDVDKVNGSYKEIIAELEAMRNGEKPDYAVELLGKVGVI